MIYLSPSPNWSDLVARQRDELKFMGTDLYLWVSFRDLPPCPASLVALGTFLPQNGLMHFKEYLRDHTRNHDLKKLLLNHTARKPGTVVNHQPAHTCCPTHSSYIPLPIQIRWEFGGLVVG